MRRPVRSRAPNRATGFNFFKPTTLLPLALGFLLTILVLVALSSSRLSGTQQGTGAGPRVRTDVKRMRYPNVNAVGAVDLLDPLKHSGDSGKAVEDAGGVRHVVNAELGGPRLDALKLPEGIKKVDDEAKLTQENDEESDKQFDDFKEKQLAERERQARERERSNDALATKKSEEDAATSAKLQALEEEVARLREEAEIAKKSAEDAKRLAQATEETKRRSKKEKTKREAKREEDEALSQVKDLSRKRRDERRAAEDLGEKDRERQEELLRGAEEKAKRILEDKQKMEEEWNAEQNAKKEKKKKSTSVGKTQSEPEKPKDRSQDSKGHIAYWQDMLEEDEKVVDGPQEAWDDKQVFRAPKKGFTDKEVAVMDPAERQRLADELLDEAKESWQQLIKVWHDLHDGRKEPHPVHGESIVLEPFPLIDPGVQPKNYSDTIHVHKNGDHNTWFTLPRPDTFEKLWEAVSSRCQQEGDGHELRRLWGPDHYVVSDLDHIERDVYVTWDHDYFVWPSAGDLTTQWLSFSDGHRSPVISLSHGPRVLYVEDFLEKEEMEHIIGLAAPKMARSRTGSGNNDAGVSEIRTSSTYWVFDKSEIVHKVSKRVEELVNVPMSLAEMMQVLHYEDGQHYWAHHDYFPEAEYTKPGSLFYGNHNRFITVFMYLSDVEEGGETNFPRFNAGNGDVKIPPDAIQKCIRGLKVRPRAGTVVVFYSLTADGHRDGAGDVTSLHQACDVVEGDKWSANYWLRNKKTQTNGGFREPEGFFDTF